MPAPLLVAHGLTKAYGRLPIVTDLDLAAGPGEAIALTGPNGAGKTTILRMLVGSEAPDAGTVTFDGHPVRGGHPAVRRGIASVLDDITFFPDLSVAEHLDLLARAHGVPEPTEVVEATLAEWSLTSQADQLPVTLSSGQRRRLALATVLVRPRRLIILDEPEQRLDADAVARLGDRLVREREQGGALVLASHDPALVEQVATRVVAVGS